MINLYCFHHVVQNNSRYSLTEKKDKKKEFDIKECFLTSTIISRNNALF